MLKEKYWRTLTIILHKDITLQELTHYFSIPDKIGIVFLVNDLPQNKEYRLSEGDEVRIFSFIGGG